MTEPQRIIPSDTLYTMVTKMNNIIDSVTSIDATMTRYCISEKEPSQPNINDRWDKILDGSNNFDIGSEIVIENASLEPNTQIWFQEI
jgi:hypothetical protein